VWCGPADCHRSQGEVLWEVAQETARRATSSRCGREEQPSGHHVDRRRATRAGRGRGGVLPFNVLPFGGESVGGQGHPAHTPLRLCDWWTRYLVPPGGAVLDPFAGSGTTGVAALRRGCTFVGVEKEAGYVEVARRRLAEVDGPLFAGVNRA
jgi:hypothetical protein